MFWFIVLLLLAGAGFYFYQKMMEIEREIRAEQVPAEPSPVTEKNVREEDTTDLDDSAEEDVDSPIVTPEVDQMVTKAVPVADDSMSLEDEILAAVANLPGLRQTELYESFADVGKKKLQQVVKELSDSGKLKREKEGSSFLLYPND